MRKNAKLNKIYGLSIKIAIIVFAFWFIYKRLFVKDKLYETLLEFKENFAQPEFVKTILLVCALMIVNWGLETFKWKYLIRKIENVPFVKAFIAVLSGVTVSIFMPNRVGDYAGRVFILEKADRWEGVLITLLGSLSQLLITIITGAVTFIFFAHDYFDLAESPFYYYNGLILIVSILVFLLLLLFFNVSFLTNVINRLPGKLKKLRHYGSIFSLYSNYELAYVLLLSFGRYLVFFTQFYLLLIIFGVNIPVEQAFLMTSMIYLTMAAIPTIALTELGVRGSVSLYFIGLYFTYHNPSGQNELGVLTASSVIWLINLAIPALLGAIFVFRLKFFRKD